MMRMITIRGTGIVTSAAGFGCADVFRAPTARRRRRLLDAAHAAGIRHFDVAPMYGLGLAERELGRFARGRRDETVIATKFGIAPTAAALAIARGQGPLRRLLAARPALRRQARSSAAGPSAGPAGALLYRATGFDAAAAQASLERSLRDLRTDHVDLLLLHDPQPGDVRSDDVCGYLVRARDAGLIRAWGVAGEPQETIAVAEALPVDAPVLQVRHDLLMTPPAAGGGVSWSCRITFGVLGRALDAVVRHVGADAGRRRAWREAVGHDCAVAEVVAPLLLRQAARENPAGVVLLSTIDEDHLDSAVAAVAAPPAADEPQLDAFVGLVREELLAAPIASRAER